MHPRKKTCYFPEESPKPFVVYHADHGIFSELRIIHVGGESEVASLTVDDAFQPSMEVGGKAWFRPLLLPRKLRFGASLAAVLQGPPGYIRPEDCYKGYPKKVAVRLADGTAFTFGLWDIIRCKAT